MRDYNLYGVGATTGSAFQMLMVNGPSRDRMGIDYCYGCMGGATGRGSRTIGRAVALCLRNIGGQKAGLTTKSCFGQPARLGMCFGEWEELLPWPSLADAARLRPTDDVVHLPRRHGDHGAVSTTTAPTPATWPPTWPAVISFPVVQQDAPAPGMKIIGKVVRGR